MKEIFKPKNPCEAEFHVENCACQRCKKKNCSHCNEVNCDHITGKAIARELGWSHNQIERKSNKQWLSRACHTEKDRNTCEVVRALRWQKKHFIGVGKFPKVGIGSNE